MAGFHSFWSKFGNNVDLYPIHLVTIIMQLVTIGTWLFVVRYNGWLSNIVVSVKLGDAS